MWHSDKYKNFLIFIALKWMKWSNETKKHYQPYMPTSAINFIILNYQSDENVRTDGHQTLRWKLIKMLLALFSELLHKHFKKHHTKSD